MDAPEYQQRVLGFVVLAMYNSGRPALVGQIQWHCRPNLAHVPEFDTYALWQIILPTFFGVKNYFISSPFFLLLFIDLFLFWNAVNVKKSAPSSDVTFFSFFLFLFFPETDQCRQSRRPQQEQQWDCAGAAAFREFCRQGGPSIFGRCDDISDSL